MFYALDCIVNSSIKSEDSNNENESGNEINKDLDYNSSRN